MAASSFRVSWNSFPSHVLSALDNLRLDEDFVDVSIYCGRRLIKAHRNVLSASSNYFKEIFKSNPSSHPVVILCDVDHASLRSLVDFMYHGEIEVPTTQLDQLLRLGELLQVQGISSLKSDSVSTPEESSSFPAPPTDEPAAAEPALPDSDVIAPECVITERSGGVTGRRRRRSRRRTTSAGEAAADAGPAPTVVSGQAPLPMSTGPALSCGAPPLPPPPPPAAAHDLPTAPVQQAGSAGETPQGTAEPAGQAAPEGGPHSQLRVKAEWPDEPAPDAPSDSSKLLLDESEHSGLDMSQYSGGIFGGGVGSRRPLTGAERARRYRERKKLKKLYEALLGGSPRREQLTVQL